MKSEKLMDYIGQIDNEIIAEADVKTAKVKPAKHILPAWASVAAACAAVAVVAVVLWSQPDTAVTPPDIPNLPMLTISGNANSYGFEGLMAYDVNELQNGNPWTISDTITALPVFQNPASYDAAGKPVTGLSADEMIRKANETALAMGLTVDSVYTNPTEEDLRRQQEKEQYVAGNEEFTPDATPDEAVAVCGSVTVRVQANGEVSIWFEPGEQLPDAYSFAYSFMQGNSESYHGTTERQAAEVLEYLLNRYAPIVAMESPTPALSWEYDIHGRRFFDYSAFENSGSLPDRILGYNFNRVTFSPGEDGFLWIIRRSNMDLSQIIGEYPVITAQEARELLLQNHYISTVMEGLPGEEYIASVELIYRTGRDDEVFMPYYRFLVELPSMRRDDGLKTFGAFYVPAVDGRYLTNMPLWDGSFN
jgi:hypothetical protein